MPKSTIQISPARGSVLAKYVVPGFPLFFGAQQRIRPRGDGKRHVIPQLHLSEKNVERVAGFHAEASKDLFGAFEAFRGNTSAEKSRVGHGSNVLEHAHMSILLPASATAECGAETGW